MSHDAGDPILATDALSESREKCSSCVALEARLADLTAAISSNGLGLLTRS